MSVAWDTAYSRLASIPLSEQSIAQSFAIATGARRVVYFSPDIQGGLCLVGTDAGGTAIRRFTPSALDVGVMRVVQRGIDGLCPIADRDPGLWMSVCLGEKAGAIVAIDLPRAPESTFEPFCDMALARIVADREIMATRQRAATDGLTGLYRREALEGLVATWDRFNVVLIDLNGLKRVNDKDGHAAGDRYIKSAAAALQQAMRAGDPVARFGGDEFVVATTADGDVVERLKRSLAAHGVSASLGSARVPIDAPNLAAALALADERMYDAKRAHYASTGETR